MAAKKRYMNPAIGDTVELDFFVYNSNNRMDLHEVQKVEIWYLDPNEKTEDNPDGRRLIQTITSITHTDTGEYKVSVDLVEDTYVIGEYRDVWYVVFRDGDDITTQEKQFQVYPDLWYTGTSSIVYDFSFRFQPNRLRKGSKQYLIIQVRPNVRQSSELEEYYTNLAISASMNIYIEQECVECMPDEQDLRMIVDGDSVDYREKCLGYYFLDTSEDGLYLKEGIYNVFFQMDFGESTYISEKLQLQIF
jgi:hypothetical protein